MMSPLSLPQIGAPLGFSHGRGKTVDSAGSAVFVDAGGNSVDPINEFPRTGLTVVSFRNTHLIYAVTWFALAALSIFGVVLL